MKKFSPLFLIFIGIISIIVIFSVSFYFATLKQSDATTITKEGFNNENPNIIVSFTTSPKRIIHIEKIIKNIENQTIKPSKIVLNLPFVFKRTNTEFTEMPVFITDNPLIQVNRCEDIGPCTKIIPTTKLFTDPETIIISIDDDISYSNSFIENLLKYSNKNPNAVVTGQSFMRIKSPNNDDINYAELVEGYSSVLYKKKFFDNFDIEKLKEYPKYCYFADDFIISNYLLKENIPIIVVDSNEKMIEDAYLDYGSQGDALKNGADGNTTSNMDNYKKCSAFLKSKNDLHINYSFE